MVKIISDRRSLILAYNTVERLLKGDYFHFSSVEDVLGDLESFDRDWPILGIGTTNWYRRNGEAIVAGTAGEPRLLWADPNSEPVGRILDLLAENPDHLEELKSPFVGEDESKPQFPFIALAICNPESKSTTTIPAGAKVHDWAIERFATENIGLAAIQVHGTLLNVKSTAAYHLPLGGVDLKQGYAEDSIFKFIEVDSGTWNLQGLFAVNPTIQEVLSVPGIPLHLHGYEIENRIGGHINQAIATETTEITIFPIQDINIRIRNLDQATLPVKKLE